MSYFDEIIKEMTDIHARKAADYGGGDEFGNFQESCRIGVPDYKGAFIRLQDKYTRCCNLMSGNRPMVEDESLEDTLIDMANYSVLVLAMLRRAKMVTKMKETVNPSMANSGMEYVSRDPSNRVED